MENLYALKEKLSIVGAELKKVSAELMEKAADASVPIDDVTALEAKQNQLQKRFDVIKDQYDKAEAAHKAALQESQKKNPIENAKTDEAKIIAAKAEYVRAKIEKRPVSDEAIEILNTITPLRAIPTGGNGGEDFLTTTKSNELISEPFVKNPLRGKVGMTSIKGLELPKIAFSLDDDAFITDAQTAKEIQLSGDTVSFGRNKFKVKARISDTVLHGSDADLVSYVENALRSGLAAKEKKVAFASGDSLTIESFYEDDGATPAEYLIEAVTGSDMYEAITNALADLHEDFRENAQVCMRYADYVTMLKELSNGARDLYGKQPQEIIGAPVFFSDSAYVTAENEKVGVPIVGDFQYYHINYEPDVIYDSDKDIDSGDYIWALTAWFDAKFKLRSAFRLAVVEAVEEG